MSRERLKRGTLPPAQEVPNYFFIFYFQFSVFFIYIKKENGKDSVKVNKDHNFFEYLHVLLLFLVSNKLHKLYEQFG